MAGLRISAPCNVAAVLCAGAVAARGMRGTGTLAARPCFDALLALLQACTAFDVLLQYRFSSAALLLEQRRDNACMHMFIAGYAA